MKYQLLFATCLLQYANAQNQFSQIAPPAQTSYEDVSKSIEDKVKADLMLQVKSFDFNPATMIMPKQTQAEIDASYNLTYPDLQGLLSRLSYMLRDHDTITAMWPDASNYADSDMFNHLHLEFDVTEEKVKLMTAATNVMGTPVHKKEYSLKGELTVNPYVPPPPAPVAVPVPAPMPVPTQAQVVAPTPAPLAPAPVITYQPVPSTAQPLVQPAQAYIPAAVTYPGHATSTVTYPSNPAAAPTTVTYPGHAAAPAPLAPAPLAQPASAVVPSAPHRLQSGNTATSTTETPTTKKNPLQAVKGWFTGK